MTTPTTATWLSEAAAARARELIEPFIHPSPAHLARHRQSLAEGAVGIALLHIDRALTGYGSWQVAHRWLETIVAGGVQAAPTNGLYQGVPAVAYILQVANADQTGRYTQARHTLHRAVITLAHQRVTHALQRISRGELPYMAEYDVINGLTVWAPICCGTHTGTMPAAVSWTTWCG